MSHAANSYQGPRLAPFAADPPIVFTPSPRLLILLAGTIFLGGMGLGFLLASLVTPRVVEVRLNGKALTPRKGGTRFVPDSVREREPSPEAATRLRMKTKADAIPLPPDTHGEKGER